MDFGDDFVAAAPNTNSEEVDPAAEFLAQEKSILGDLEAEINAGSAATKAPAASEDAGLLGGDINELAAGSSGGLESSTGSFEMIGSENNELSAKMASSSSSKRPKLDPILNCKRENYLSWDDYFMANAVLASKRSKDPITQVGAVIVNEDKRIVGTGYNGLPNKCSDDEFPWYKVKQVRDIEEWRNKMDPNFVKQTFVVHAEANAIMNKNSADLKNTTLYTTLFPCNECAKLIIQAGIKKIYYLSDKLKGKYASTHSRLMFDAAEIVYMKFEPNIKEVVIKLVE